MRSLLWVTRPDLTGLAGAQHVAMQNDLRDDGWEVASVPYHHRLLCRSRRAHDVLVWTFVPTQLEVWLAKRTAVKQVGVVHELGSEVERIPSLDHWVTASESLRTELCSRGAAPSVVSTLRVVPPWETGFAINLRQELGLGAGTPLVYSGGSTTAASGHRIAVWALNILNYLHPEVHLVIQGDGGERERVETFHRSIDDRVRVHFVPATWPVASILNQVEQVWLPRQSDGVSDALLFALQGGRPIVASRLPSHAEWLRHEANALLVRHDQPAEWAAAANRLLTDNHLTARLATASRLTTDASEHFATVLRTVLTRPRALAA